MPSYETFPSDNTTPPLVSVCTSAVDINVQGFIDELREKFPDMDFKYYQLPYNDIDTFKFKAEDINIMILCPSINNRRFAISDAMDALYDKFLHNSVKVLGRDRICIIAHDFPKRKGLENPDKYRAEMGIFEGRQPTAFKTSALVMMGGKLETKPVELHESNWDALKGFLQKAEKSPMPISTTCWDQCVKAVEECPRWLSALTVLLMIVLGLGIGLGVGLCDRSPTSGVSTTPFPSGSTPAVAANPTANYPTTPPSSIVPSLSNQPPHAGISRRDGEGDDTQNDTLSIEVDLYNRSKPGDDVKVKVKSSGELIGSSQRLNVNDEHHHIEIQAKSNEQRVTEFTFRTATSSIRVNVSKTHTVISERPDTASVVKPDDTTGISDKKLDSLGEELGDDQNLMTLGIQLGFPRSNVATFLATNRADGGVSSKGTKNMLFAWRNMTPGANQVKKLHDALVEARLGFFADKYFPNSFKTGAFNPLATGTGWPLC